MRNADPTGWPVLLRTALVAGLVVLIAGAGLFAWRWYSRPTTLTIAVGSLDGEASRMISALASKLAQQKAPVRFSPVEAGTALEAAEYSHPARSIWRSSGAMWWIWRRRRPWPSWLKAWCCWWCRPDPPSPIWPGLKRLAVGVIGGDTNKRLIKILTDEYGLAQAGVTFKNFALPDIRRALELKEVRALLVVMPLSDKYLSMLRGFFPQTPGTGPVLIPLDQAAAIAEKDRAYESFDVRRGRYAARRPIPPMT